LFTPKVHLMQTVLLTIDTSQDRHVENQNDHGWNDAVQDRIPKFENVIIHRTENIIAKYRSVVITAHTPWKDDGTDAEYHNVHRHDDQRKIMKEKSILRTDEQ
jgi:hypothetical protein